YVAVIRYAAGWVGLPSRRHYPNPPTPTAAERVGEVVNRFPFRPRGWTVSGFGPDPCAHLVDGLPSVPAVPTFPLAGRIPVLVANRRVAVVACANWPPGRYTRHGELSVTRDGQPYRDPGSAVARTVKALAWLSTNLPARAVVRAFVVVTTEIGGVVELGNDT